MSSASLAPRKYQLFIDGQWIHDREAHCEVRNPSDEGVIGIVPRATAGRMTATRIRGASEAKSVSAK